MKITKGVKVKRVLQTIFFVRIISQSSILQQTTQETKTKSKQIYQDFKHLLFGDRKCQ